MDENGSQDRANPDAWTQMTGVGLLVEAGVCAILALLPFIIGELSDLELFATVSVILVGGILGWPILFAPRVMSVSSIGRLCFVLITAVQFALLAVIAIQLADYADPVLGMDVGATAFDLVAATYVIVLLTGCVRVLAAPNLDLPASNRRRLVSRVGLAVALGCLVLGSALTLAGDRVRCATFDFDAARWKEDGPTAVQSVSARERIAPTLVRCDTLEGKTRAEVEEMLGAGGPRRRSQSFDAGNVSDAIGPGDADSLIVRYDDSGKVNRARLLYGS